MADMKMIMADIKIKMANMNKDRGFERKNG